MLVFPVGEPVFLLRFLPDGRRLFVGTGGSGLPVRFAVWPVGGGEPVRLDLPDFRYEDWYFSNNGTPVAFHPTRPLAHLAWAGVLRAFDPDTGGPVATARGTVAHQLATSPDGSRVLTAATRYDQPRRLQGFVVGDGKLPPDFPVAEQGLALGGFLPDGDRFVTVEAGVVRVRSFATGAYLAAGRHKLKGTCQSQVCPDGRWWAGYGYHSFYLVPLDPIDKPRRISGSRSSGDFVSFAFHPAGRSFALIHGGPTLVKVYDIASLKQTAVFKWKLGPLGAVTYSPDGTLAAAGSVDGRVVVWDVEG